MKKTIITLFFLIITIPALAGTYTYVSPDQVKVWIETNTPVTIVDIQVKEEFNVHHITGSLATYAYPTKTDEDKTKLDIAISAAVKNDHPVVIVCPRGKGGAKRSYDYMAANQISEKRLLILKGGMNAWPYIEMVKKR